MIIYAILTMSLFAGVRSMLELVLVNYALVAWIGLCRLFPLITSRTSSSYNKRVSSKLVKNSG